VRKYNEKFSVHPKPFYFDEIQNPDDPQGGIYYRYNNKYFEVDLKNKDWSRLPDIYGENLPKEIEEFHASNKTDTKK